MSILLSRVDGTDRHQHGGVRSLPAESAYLLPRDNRDMGIVYSGSHERLRAVLGKMLSGKQQAHISIPLRCAVGRSARTSRLPDSAATSTSLGRRCAGRPTKLGFVGGSCTEGGGTDDDKPWHAWPNRCCLSGVKAMDAHA